MFWYKESGLKQAPAAKQLGITQPRFNQLLKGKIKDFSLDALVNLAGAAGLQLNLNVEPFPKTKANATPKRAPLTGTAKIPMKKTRKAA
jgi:transcriptional regulator with XRE-family HTH domain